MRCNRCKQNIPDFLFIGDDHPVLLDHPVIINTMDFHDNPDQAKVTAHAYVSKTQMCSDLSPAEIAYTLPDDVVYHAAIRLGAYATVGKHSSQIVPDLLFMDALKRWADDHKVG